MHQTVRAKQLEEIPAQPPFGLGEFRRVTPMRRARISASR